MFALLGKGTGTKWLLEVLAKPLSFLVLSIDFLVMEATWLAKKCWDMSVVCEK